MWPIMIVYPSGVACAQRRAPVVPPAPATFSTDTSGLEECARPALVELGDGATFELRIAPVVKRIGDDAVIGPNAVVMTHVPAGAIVAAPQSRIVAPPPRREAPRK